MKILHTADWHIGKVLHKQDLYEDISLFFEWLLSYLKAEDIDVLLVSGDVFDLANPSNRDTKLYFDMLHRLANTNTKVIITGGNHDSISLLDAPAALLDGLNITVIGGARLSMEDEIIPIYTAQGEVACVVLAVPFLRDKDLRTAIEASKDQNKSAQVALAIKKHYDDLVGLAHQKYGTEAPIIAMGHLYMQGSITSDSERDIHVGNLQGLDANVIHPAIKYMALGHIHKPQRINKQDHIRYSGSPVFLDFSERDYEKMVITFEAIDNTVANITAIPIPKHREVIKFSGELSDVATKLHDYTNPYRLTTFIELEVIESKVDHLKIKELEDLVGNYDKDQGIILKNRISFKDRVQQIIDINDTDTTSIHDLTPLQIFEQKLANELLDEEMISDLKTIYMELIQELND